MDKTVHLEIVPRESLIKSLADFMLSLARESKVPDENRKRLKTAFDAAMLMVVQNNTRDPHGGKIALDMSVSGGRFTVKIINRGIPILPGTGTGGDSKSELHTLLEYGGKAAIENFGREGQVLTLEAASGGDGAKETAKARRSADRAPVSVREGDIVIRSLEPGEEPALSRLFYSVYGYTYIKDMVYYPEKIAKMINAGKLISTVAALPDGRLAGHVGLVKCGDSPPVYEAALGLVDPAFKSKGLFRDLFHKSMEILSGTSMHYCFFKFVTNHPYSQQLISRYGTRDMALFIGCQSDVTQASLEKLGLGPDPRDMDRYTILFSIIPGVDHPFGTEISLSPNLGEKLEFLLKPLGLTWIPSSRFQFLPEEGRYDVSRDPAQNAVKFDLFKPGRKAVESIVREWRGFLRDGYEYVAVDVPVSELGRPDLYNMLTRSGFFIAGFIPHHATGKLAFRFQSIGPARVAFREIKVVSDTGKKLLEIIEKDHKGCRLV